MLPFAWRWRGQPTPDDLLTKCNVYVTTQRTDDLKQLLEEVGDDNLIIGTDYGHKDIAVELDALKRLEADGALPKQSVDKIMQTNPGILYGIR